MMAGNDNFLPTQDPRFPDWQRHLQAALRETHPQKVQQRVFSLEEAIVRRQEFLAYAPDTEAEKQALADAARALRVIQVEKLQYPHWNKR
jgi:hypothetical protein